MVSWYPDSCQGSKKSDSLTQCFPGSVIRRFPVYASMPLYFNVTIQIWLGQSDARGWNWLMWPRFQAQRAIHNCFTGDCNSTRIGPQSTTYCHLEPWTCYPADLIQRDLTTLFTITITTGHILSLLWSNRWSQTYTRLKMCIHSFHCWQGFFLVRAFCKPSLEHGFVLLDILTSGQDHSFHGCYRYTSPSLEDMREK